MYNKALEILNIFNEHGFKAYIVGGYPRDTLLNVKTDDIDICTSATPKDILNIFKTSKVQNVNYGSVRVTYKNNDFDITTFRKDIKYEKNRKPVKIKYINDLKKDLLRRDFTINTLCIDSEGNYIDLLNGKEDIDKKIIRTVGNPKSRIKEDSLRILRAIRFATNLNFQIEKKTEEAIKKYGSLLETLSISRKKDELNKIFSNKNKEIGRKLILDMNLDGYLGLNNLKDIVMCDDIIGIWSQLDLKYEYPFTKLEKKTIKDIRNMLSEKIDSYNIYKYGLYISTVVGSIKNKDLEEINKKYRELPIYSKKDIDITAKDISDYLKRKPDNYISDIMKKIEKLIIEKKLSNDKDELLKYIGDKYGNIQ